MFSSKLLVVFLKKVLRLPTGVCGAALMDDVWVVIGLLLFGSLLFCLCCYKVSNLLYMLYHIDDDPDSTAHAAGGTGDLTAVGVASVANAAASLVVANASTERKSSKATIKAGNASTNESPTTQLPEKVNIAQLDRLVRILATLRLCHRTYSCLFRSWFYFINCV